MLWNGPIPWLAKVFTWVSEYLSEVWLFSMAVFILWHPAFPERLQNGICIAGLMSVASALIRLKKVERKLDELRSTQLLEAGLHLKKLKKKGKIHEVDSLDSLAKTTGE